MPSPLARRHAIILLLLVLLLAEGLRFYRLGTAPPGLHVDAGANAWNARCLLETGRDWTGASWPVFYSRGFGENQTALYYYALMPFQALGGMSEATTALPSAVAGVLSVLLLYLVGARLFGRTVGLVAAALLTLTPWHLFLSRWGHESGLVPLLTVAPLAALLGAGLPLADPPGPRPRVLALFLGGALTGICCWGYYAMRVFLPALLLGAAAASPRGFVALARDRRGRAALLALTLGLAATLGPLAWAHLTDPEIGKRPREFTAWQPSDPFAVRLLKVAARYPGPFGPDFLFLRGDTFPLHALPASGPLLSILAPLLLAGAASLLAEARRSVAARTLLVWIAVYPIADVLARHEGVHLLRSSPGVCGLVLLAAVGAVRAVGWIARRSRRAAVAAGVVLAAAVALQSGRFVAHLFGEYNRRFDVHQIFNVDLLEASRWIRPRLDEVDAVFVSAHVSAALSQPFIVTLVGLDYDPRRWFAEPVEVERRADTDRCRSFGKVRFLFEPSDLEAVSALQDNGREDRVILVLRPGEWSRGEPVHRVLLPDGRPTFLIYDERM